MGRGDVAAHRRAGRASRAAAAGATRRPARRRHADVAVLGAGDRTAGAVADAGARRGRGARAPARPRERTPRVAGLPARVRALRDLPLDPPAAMAPAAPGTPRP